MTIRQVYFLHIRTIYLSKYLNDPQFFRLLALCNGFSSKEEVTIHFDDEMKNEDMFNKCLEEILKGKMFEYVVGEAYFDKKYFKVNNNVLIPRQETEELLTYFRDVVKKMYHGVGKLSIADICTGSGCLAVSIADGPLGLGTIYASDISPKAIEVARENNKKFKTDVKFLLGNITDPFVEKGIKLDCIICNPPYISDSSGIDQRTWEQEPHEALLASPNTYFYEYIFKNASKILKPKHIMAFEIGEDMKESLHKIARNYFKKDRIEFIKDMDNKWRFMFITSKSKDKTDAVDALKNHGVIAFPTETVMGLGIAYDDKIAFERLNKIKGRPENKPYSLMLGMKQDIYKYAHVSRVEKRIIDKFLPGPLTILLKKKELPEWVTLGSPYVGIRVPKNKDVRAVINAAGKPILAPSANRSGEAPAKTAKEVEKIFGEEIDCILPGRALNGIASTIVMVDNGIKIIRQGKITKEEIEEVINNEDCDRK